jgi:hypothetical protein
MGNYSQDGGSEVAILFLILILLLLGTSGNFYDIKKK